MSLVDLSKSKLFCIAEFQPCARLNCCHDGCLENRYPHLIIARFRRDDGSPSLRQKKVLQIFRFVIGQ
jgi:hypothetical protein